MVENNPQEILPAHRLGSVSEYYFSIKLKEVAKLKSEGKPIINMGIGSPDLPPPTEVIEELISASKQNQNGYQSYIGQAFLREAICAYYQKNYGLSFSADNEILPLLGSKEGIMHISMAFLNKGDKVLLPNPGYPTYTSVSNLLETDAVFYDLTSENKWLPDVNQIKNLIIAHQPKILWLNYPHMPTGAKPSKEIFRELVVLAKEYNVLLVNDNPYSLILNTEEPFSIFQIEGAKQVALELNSLSKTFNIAGWRVGMVLGKEEFIQNIIKVKSNMDSGMYYGIQKAASKALTLGESWFKQINAEYKKRRELVHQICDSLKLSYDKNTMGMFVWAKLPEDIDEMEYIDTMLYQKDIFITPGSIFGSNGKGYVRFSLCVNLDDLNQVKKRLT